MNRELLSGEALASLLMRTQLYFPENKMTPLIDLHCHILPYVDDGAVTFEESMHLLKMQYEQGVRVICATPHLRKNMFETSDQDVTKQFLRFRRETAKRYPDMKVFLSREYHCDDLLKEHLEQKNVFKIGPDDHLLIEFSYSNSIEQIWSYLSLVQKAGYKPVIAHAERYPALLDKTDEVRTLIQSGAKIQVNAGSVLGREGRKQKKWCAKMLKEQLVFLVASDAHDTEMRLPELGKCAAVLRRKYGDAYARKLLYERPFEILMGTKER